jgi:hypothetical protein
MCGGYTGEHDVVIKPKRWEDPDWDPIFDEEDEDDHDYDEDDGDALASAGFGTDEDYGG